MTKRKRSSVAAVDATIPSPTVLPYNIVSVASELVPGKPSRQTGKRQSVKPSLADIDVNPDTNPSIEDGQEALRASPDAEVKFEAEEVVGKVGRKHLAATPKASKAKTSSSDSELSELKDVAAKIALRKPNSRS